MAVQPVVHCRTCKCVIDRSVMIKDVDWFERAKGYNYCKTCWENFTRRRKQAKNGEAYQDNEFDDDIDFWFEASFDYLNRDMRLAPDYIKFKKQYESFIKEGMRPKGIYYALRYYYEQKSKLPYSQEKEKANGGCGIVPYIYNEAVGWWSNKMKQDASICERIEAQIKASIEAKQKTKVIQKKQPFDVRKKIDMSAIATWEDEE